MNINQELNDKDAAKGIFEPFPKPQTIPCGWDLSAITPENGKTDSPEQKPQQFDV